MQEINKAKISMSLVERQRGEGGQAFPTHPEEERLHEMSRNHQTGVWTPGSPSWKAALIWSLTGSLLHESVTVGKSHLENRAMQPSSRNH